MVEAAGLMKVLTPVRFAAAAVAEDHRPACC